MKFPITLPSGLHHLCLMGNPSRDGELTGLIINSRLEPFSIWGALGHMTETILNQFLSLSLSFLLVIRPSSSIVHHIGQFAWLVWFVILLIQVLTVMLKNDFPKFCLTEGKNPTTESEDKKVLDLVLLNIGEKQHFLIIFLFFCKDSRKVLESGCSYGEKINQTIIYA